MPRKKAAAPDEAVKLRKKPGPKPGQIPPAILKSIRGLAELGCTQQEMSIFLKRSLRTVQRWAQLPIVQEAIEHGDTKGLISLRRVQYRTALKGDRTMLIWLGKQRLNQKDKQEIQHTGGVSVVVKRLQAARARLAAIGPPKPAEPPAA